MMTKKEIRAAVERFIADETTNMSERLLAELAGISIDTFRNVFKHKTTDITPTTQIRMERALKALENGEVSIYKRRDRTRYIAYRKEAKIPLNPGLRLTLKGGQVGLKVGMRNKNCYTETTFKEELER
jgi:hypothetical protein